MACCQQNLNIVLHRKDVIRKKLFFVPARKVYWAEGMREHYGSAEKTGSRDPRDLPKVKKNSFV